MSTLSRVAAPFAALLLICAGCLGGKDEKRSEEFFTSGSREADQRASQRMAKAEQLEDAGEETGEGDVKDAKPVEAGAKPAQAEGKLSLYERLGGDKGLRAIVADFLPRALHDPRVDWPRRSVKPRGLFRRKAPPAWEPTEEAVDALEERFVQFLALATGGPSVYEGRDLEAVHADMRISNPEFDAALGDLKASLDKLRIPNKEQKELLAILESTRPQIVTVR